MQITELEKVLTAKDEQISELLATIKEINSRVDFQTEFGITNVAQESSDETSDDESDKEFSEGFQCNYCEFITSSKVGLKIHDTKVHVIECDHCNKHPS